MMPQKEVLIVTGELTVAHSLREKLGEWGYTLAGICSTEGDIHKILERQKVDLLLIDIQPNGHAEGASMATGISQKFNTPVIFIADLSGKDPVNHTEIPLGYGYLTKPFRDEDLCRTIENAIYRHAIEKTIKEENNLLKKLLKNLDATLQEQTKRFTQTNDAFVIFYTLAEQSYENIVITNKDEEIEYVNPAFVKTYGYPLEEVAGKSFNILKSGEHSKEFYEEMRKAINSGNFFQAEFTNLNKSKERVIEEKVIFPLKSRDGKVSHYVSTGRDITQKKRDEGELAKRQALISHINASTPVITYIVDLGERKLSFISSNVLSILGYTEAEAMQFTQSSVLDLIHPTERKKLIEKYDRSDIEPNKEIRIKTKAGKYKWFLLSETVFAKNGAGETTQILGVATDITSNKANEKKMRALMRLNNIMQKQQHKIKTQALIHGQEEERRRISMDLHDGVGQMLSALKLQIESCIPINNENVSEDKVREISELISQSISETRRITSHLAPPGLYDFGLFFSVKKIIDTLTKSNKIKGVFSSNIQNIRFESKIEIAVYRIIQEAISNCIKHANATILSVDIMHISDLIIIKIFDDGDGFDSSLMHQSKSMYSGNGLLNMFERCRLLSGKTSLMTNPGKGFEINFTIPAKTITT